MVSSEKLLKILYVLGAYLQQYRREKKRKSEQKKKYNKEYLCYLKRRVELASKDGETCKQDISISREDFLNLADIKKSSKSPTKKTGAKEEVYIGMLYLTKGLTFRMLARLFGMSPSTISNIVHTFIDFVNENIDTIKLPQKHEEWITVMEKFRGKNLVPCLGALDGKHISIKKPPNSGTLYYNYKKFFSVVLMGLVDSDRRFIYATCGHPGSTNDAAIYNESELKSLLDTSTPNSIIIPGTPKLMKPFVIADGIFPISKNLVKPFSLKNMTPEQAKYNLRISGTRVYVEQAFGMLAARFQIFKHAIDLPVERVNELVMCCVKLHNWVQTIDNDKRNIYSSKHADSFATANEQREYLKGLIVAERI